MNDWICSQLGAREKYAIPRALKKAGRLNRLYTDIWAKPNSIVHKLDKRLSGRYHPELKDARVNACTPSALLMKMQDHLLKKTSPIDLSYDTWLSSQLLKHSASKPFNFFGYSYSSRKSLMTAKSLGYRTVLGQINPGPAEAGIVSEAFKAYKGGVYQPTVPDESYWDRWREETGYADKIIVNSPWSLQLLNAAGVPAEKCVVVPLAYESKDIPIERKFKNAFDRSAPLRLLFLGGIGIRKGFHLLTDAMRSLISNPVHLDVVGVLKGPAELIRNLPGNVTLHGAVPASEVDKYYQSADLFLFPTLSDGFGLTQLEAQARKLPVITSQYCAPVITHRHNGFVLKEVTPTAIKEAIACVLDEPDILRQWSENSVQLSDYSVAKLSSVLNEL